MATPAKVILNIHHYIIIIIIIIFIIIIKNVLI